MALPPAAGLIPVAALLPTGLVGLPPGYNVGVGPADEYTVLPGPAVNLPGEIMRLGAINAMQPAAGLVMGGPGAGGFEREFKMAAHLNPWMPFQRHRLFSATRNLLMAAHPGIMPNARVYCQFKYANNGGIRIKTLGPFPMNDWGNAFWVTRLGEQLQYSVNSSTPMILLSITWKWLNPAPPGGARHRLSDVPVNIKDARVKTREKNLIELPMYGPDDFMCAQRALVMLWKYKEFTSTDAKLRSDEMKATYKLLRKKHTSAKAKAAKRLTELATTLSNQAGVEVGRPVGYEDMNLLAQALTTLTGKHCEIQVFCVDKAMELDFTTLPLGELPPDFDEIEWYNLCRDDNHYTCITKIHKLMYNAKHYCYRCKKAYHSTHKCKYEEFCGMCFSKDVNHFKEWKTLKDPSLWRECESCNRSFYGDTCFMYHQQHACKLRWKCKSCNKSFKYVDLRRCKGTEAKGCVNPGDHKCGNVWCRNCSKHVHPEHQCFIAPTESKVSVGDTKYAYCDFECTQEPEHKRYHRVNLAVTITGDGKMWPLHRSIGEWVDHMLLKEFDGYTFVFHNGKGYDFQFILEYLSQNCKHKLKVQPVFVGGKVLYFTISKGKTNKSVTTRRFVDSLNFLPFGLARFTKTFGLEAKKGYYPHLFNTKANESYVGPIPDKKYFMVSTMAMDKVADFNAWYEEVKEREWNNWEMLVEYCIDDVKLLKAGCTQFNQLVLEKTNGLIEPFRDSITIASCMMLIYKTLYMPRETLPALHAGFVRKIKPALAGGRTGACKCYYSMVDGEIGEYYDITSMYPWVNKNGRYPKGFPVQVDMGDLDKLGLWLVDVECPQDLYHPLLHEKRDGLLMFDLTPKTRQWYTSLELKEAVRLGYTITHTHEIWQWEEECKGLFTGYINSFLKMKQEASGWPSDCKTEEEKAAYVRRYAEAEGIQLDPENIKHNPGLRTVAKLGLNSLWGKFGQRMNEEYTRAHLLFNTKDGVCEYNRIMSQPDSITNFMVMENALLLRLKGREAPEESVITSTCFPIAVFTTAQARLKLYGALYRLGPQVLYYDTDSIIFVHGPRHPVGPMDLGDFLGEWTSELKPGEHIVEFASGGPKNYSYLTNKHKELIKVKGHTLGTSATAHLNMEAMKRCIFNKQSIGVTLPQIVRDRDMKVKTVDRTKIYQFRFDKRKICPVVTKPDGSGPWYINTVPWTNPDERNDYRLQSVSTLATISQDMGGSVAEFARRQIAALEARKRKRPELTFPWVRVMYYVSRDAKTGLLNPRITTMDSVSYMRFALQTPRRHIVCHIEGFPDEDAARDGLSPNCRFNPCSPMDAGANLRTFLSDLPEDTDCKVIVYTDHLDGLPPSVRTGFLANIPEYLQYVHVL